LLFELKVKLEEFNQLLNKQIPVL